MKHYRYSVNEECISCRACVEVANDNFAMNEQDKAFVYTQPETDQEEEACREALETCPVAAISKLEAEEALQVQAVLARNNVQSTLLTYPDLLDLLASLSPQLEKLHEVVTLPTIAAHINFHDLARLGNLSTCEVLHSVNRHLGVEKKLIQNMPACIDELNIDEMPGGEAITWKESRRYFIYTPDNRPDILKHVLHLKAQENIIVISVDPAPELTKIAQDLGLQFNVQQSREYRISVYNPASRKKGSWLERKDDFEILDVRSMKTDPFDLIVKQAYGTKEDDGFVLIQSFEPKPLIQMLSEMGFDHHSVRTSPAEVRIYFHRIPIAQSVTGTASEKTDIVIQSATPVAYPVIMRLLQSERIQKAVNVRELKVWEETEKHLAWIANGKADISFTALITAAKLQNSDVKIPALFVWDNFVILTRGYQAKDFQDLIGRTIHTPLFEEAPPTKITKYLIQASGLNPDDFTFSYGKPFGRPEKIYHDFLSGEADTVMLREPEASYAIKAMQDRKEKFSIVTYSDIWNRFNPGFGSFPNAGVLFKGDFARTNPALAHVFLEELKEAINWVQNNRQHAAELSFDMMRQPVDRIKLFLERVTFDYVDGEALRDKVAEYFSILKKQGIAETAVTEEFLDIFSLE